MKRITQHMTNTRFPNPLDIREVGHGKWQLLCDYVYRDELHETIKIPKGFITDFYSVPRAVRSLVGKVQSSNGPAVIHDWLYRSQAFGGGGQRKADNLLDRAMLEHWSPVGWWTRKKIIAGLRIGGWVAYRNSAREFQELVYRLGRKPTHEEVAEYLTS